ncbi:uncharacterized protein LOC111316610 isoform X2 [Durio zibethinus]|uniref:Uncharacterized protein LOC111316610 isoform X2 n=1 Tax=Durio zibethinus TaxID=66656 RepID=A0A6P6BB88_DURZI|nr:uncharacterized protein LOC111316610 isoform X2 [Durio zibethinus]
MSAPDIASILENSRELDRLRKEQEEVLIEINKLHKKLQATPEVVEKPGDSSLSRLKGLYIQARDLSEREITISNLLLNQLDSFLPSGPPGQQRRKMDGNDQKKKRMKSDSDISRLSPSMRSHSENFVSLKDEQVAARVKSDAEKDEWFVVKVINFDEKTKEFEVLDEEPGDDEEGSGQREMIFLVLKNSQLENMFWQFIQEQLRSIRQLSSILLERGNQMSIYWNSMMMRKTELCLRGQYPFTRWLPCH